MPVNDNEPLHSIADMNAHALIKTLRADLATSRHDANNLKACVSLLLEVLKEVKVCTVLPGAIDSQVTKLLTTGYQGGFI